MQSRKKLQGGFGMIEAMVGLALISFVLIPIVTVAARTVETRTRAIQDTESALLLVEGLEAMRLIRDSGWATTSALALDQDYHLSYDGVMWKPVSGPPSSLINGVFDRRVRVSSVRRGSDQRIVSSGGVVDASSRAITVSVSWRTARGTTTKTAFQYLMNIF